MPLTKLQCLHYVHLSFFGGVNSRKSNAILLEAACERSQCPVRLTKQLREHHHVLTTSSENWYKLVRPYLLLRIYWKYTQRYSINPSQAWSNYYLEGYHMGTNITLMNSHEHIYQCMREIPQWDS